MATIFILSELETRKTPCGALTIYPPSWGSLSGVRGNSTYVLPLNSSKRNEVVGFLGGPKANSLNASSWSQNEFSNDDSSAPRVAPPLGTIWQLPNGTYEVVAFEGLCQLGAQESTKYFDLMDGNFSAWRSS